MKLSLAASLTITLIASVEAAYDDSTHQEALNSHFDAAFGNTDDSAAAGDDDDDDDDDDSPYFMPWSLTECLNHEKALLKPNKCEFAFDGDCDVWEIDQYNKEPRPCQHGTDCYDCSPDPCRKHNYNCTACGEADGCLWCPGDALCSGEPMTQALLQPFEMITSCPYEENWVETCPSSEEDSPDNLYTDELYDSMKWAFRMIEVEHVWENMGFTGEGIHVRVNDDGVDNEHEDFVDKFDVDNSCDVFYPPVADPKEDPDKLVDHGTACASIIAATANNGGAVGIAHKAEISACIAFGKGADELNEDKMLSHNQHVIDISSNSWGPDPCEYKEQQAETPTRRHYVRHLAEHCPFNPDHVDSPCTACAGMDFDLATDATTTCKKAVSDYCSMHYEIDSLACANFLDWFVSCSYAPMPSKSGSAIASGVMEGRGGKGIVYVWAAGNEYSSGSNQNLDGYLNSRFTISVASVGQDQLHASYSTPGATNFISAPGGDNEYMSNNIVAKPGGGYHDITVGTSFACPTVSGVVALMLEANPELGWRDVQGILALTAREPPLLDNSWVTNGAGLQHSNKYGFGIVNATAAVDLALDWVNWPEEQQLYNESGFLGLPIVNDATQSTTSTIQINAQEGFAAEMVSVYLDLDHASRGDLLITLTSPSGTESVLSPSKRPETGISTKSHWKLSSLKSYLEDPHGPWTLSIRDEHPRKIDGGECRDLYYWARNVKPDGSVQGYYECPNYKTMGWCAGGNVIDDRVREIVDSEDAYLDGATACCICGGGVPAPEIETLESWELVVYGHVE